MACRRGVMPLKAARVGATGCTGVPCATGDGGTQQAEVGESGGRFGLRAADTALAQSAAVHFQARFAKLRRAVPVRLRRREWPFSSGWVQGSCFRIPDCAMRKPSWARLPLPRDVASLAMWARQVRTFMPRRRAIASST